MNKLLYSGSNVRVVTKHYAEANVEAIKFAIALIAEHILTRRDYEFLQFAAQRNAGISEIEHFPFLNSMPEKISAAIRRRAARIKCVHGLDKN